MPFWHKCWKSYWHGMLKVTLTRNVLILPCSMLFHIIYDILNLATLDPTLFVTLWVWKPSSWIQKHWTQLQLYSEALYSVPVVFIITGLINSTAVASPCMQWHHNHAPSPSFNHHNHDDDDVERIWSAPMYSVGPFVGCCSGTQCPSLPHVHVQAIDCAFTERISGLAGVIFRWCNTVVFTVPAHVKAPFCWQQC